MAPIPHDPALPQLATALDVTAMTRRFDALLRKHGCDLVECRIDRVKYRPRRGCTVGYALKLRCAFDDSRVEQRVGARFCVDGSAAARYAKAMSRPQWRPGLAPTLAHLADLDCFAWFVPNDPKIASLPWLADGARLARAASQAIGPEADDALAGGALDSALVQYVPEARACARMTLGAGESARALYVKTDSGARGGDTHRLMQALSESRAQRSGRLATPLSLGWQGGTGLHWQAAAPGVPLLDLAPLPAPESMARLGDLLAALHGTPTPVARAVDVAGLGPQALAVAGLLRDHDPRLEGALALLLRELARLADDLAGARGATLHGDLHPNNVLVDGDRWTLIDWDSACRGPALLEMGAVCADLLYRALLLQRPAATAFAAIDAFVDAYRAASDTRLPDAALARATAFNLLTQRAYRCLANLKPGRLALVPALVELAAAIATRGRIALPAESLS
jgi:Ser/Thr protein kinase RdoA (MazF antagonist)